MNTKTCKHCKEQIDKKAKKCPKCGGKQGLSVFVKILIILAIIIGCVVACVNGCSNAVDDAVKENKNSYKDVNGKTSFKLNETFENKYEKITMIDANTNFKDYGQFFEPSSGKKYIMLKFEIENISENDEIYASSMSFSGYADGVAVDTKYGVGNDKYNDLSATIGKGKKAIGYIFFEVPKDTKEIKIEYNADFWTDGTMIEFIPE